MVSLSPCLINPTSEDCDTRTWRYSFISPLERWQSFSFGTLCTLYDNGKCPLARLRKTWENNSKINMNDDRWMNSLGSCPHWPAVVLSPLLLLQGN